VAALTTALAERIAATDGVDGVDYAEIVDVDTLEPASEVGGAQRVLVAARFGRTRLLDNLALETPATGN
jgi:pantoate--beta-alanine ligase